MRKFLSVVAVLVMLFALAVPAFAAEGGSPTQSGIPSVKVDSAKDTTGNSVDLVVEKPEEAVTPTQFNDAKAEAVKVAGAGATVSDAFEIHVEKNGVEDPSVKGVTAVLTYNGKGDVAGVLYMNEKGGWDYAAAKSLGGGKYEVTFEHFCTAMFVFKGQATTDPTQTQAPAATTKPAESTGTKSPQTGVDATAYIMATAALVLFAGFCFVKARKVSE